MYEIGLNGPLLLIGLRSEDISRVLPSRLTTLLLGQGHTRPLKYSKLLYWVGGNCETITNSASAEAKVEAWADLGNNIDS